MPRKLLAIGKQNVIDAINVVLKVTDQRKKQAVKCLLELWDQFNWRRDLSHYYRSRLPVTVIRTSTNEREQRWLNLKSNYFQYFSSILSQKFQIASPVFFLINVSAYGQLEIVKTLFRQGMDIETENNEALIRASQGGHCPLVEFLLSKGSDIHAQSDKAFFLACENGHLQMVKLLQSKGANIHAQNGQALIQASIYGHLNVVEFLIENGLDVHAQKDEALNQASLYGRLKVVRYLCNNGSNIHAEGDQAIVSASIAGHLPIVRYLVSKGSNIPDEAILCENPGITKYLVSERSMRINEALRIAYKKGYHDIVESLTGRDFKG